MGSVWELYAEFLFGDLPELVSMSFGGMRVFAGFLAVCVEFSIFNVISEQSVKSSLTALYGALADQPPNRVGQDHQKRHDFAFKAVSLDIPHELGPHDSRMQTCSDSLVPNPLGKCLSKHHIVQLRPRVRYVGLIILIEVDIVPIWDRLTTEAHHSPMRKG